MTQAIPGSTRTRRLGFTVLAVVAVLAATLIGANRFGGNSANAQTGTASITIVKQGLVGTDVANFTSDLPGGATFSLSEAGGTSKTFSDIEAGTYSVTEAAMPGYTLTSMGCALSNSRAAPSLTSAEGNTLGITVADGQSLTCTFVNAQAQTAENTVTVSKVIDGLAQPTGSFDFTATWTATNLNGGAQASGNFSLNSGNGYTATTDPMAAGASYSVVENGIDGTCGAGDTYRLVGYGTGSTAAAAAAAAPGPSASFTNIQANQFVVVHNEPCAAQQYTVSIAKMVDDAAPTTGVFNFTANWTAANLGGGAPGSGPFTLDSSNSWQTSTVPLDAGASYSITEDGITDTCTPGATYRLAGYGIGATAAEAAADTSLDTTASFTDLQANQFVVVHNVTCPVGTSSITIVKAGLTGGAVANFTHDIPGVTPNTFSLSASDNSETFENLPAGTYKFTEMPMEGWTLVSTGCSLAPPPTLSPTVAEPNVLTVILGTNEDQTCTFTNAPVTNDVTIAKYVDGKLATDGSYTLTETRGESSDTTQVILDASDNFQFVSKGVVYGSSYGLTEDGIDMVCDPGDEYRLAGYSVGSTLEEAAAAPMTDALSIDSVTAGTFVIVWNQDCANIASITIVKDFNPDPTGDLQAGFTTEGAGLTDFSIGEGAANGRTFDNLNAGAYTFTEDHLAGWTIQSIFCSGQSSPSNVLINLGGASATVTLSAGDEVTCTFTNMPDPNAGTGSITIHKVWDGTDGPDAVFTTSANLEQTGDTFTLTTTAPSESWTALAADTYTFTETAIPGWTLTEISCTGIVPASMHLDLTARSLGIDLAEGEDADCTFTNTQDTSTAAPAENPSALSPFVPVENLPAVNLPAAPAPNAVSPETPSMTNAPSSSVPTNPVTNDSSSPSAVSPAPVTNNTGTTANVGLAPSTSDTSALSGAVTAATPVAPSTGNATANHQSGNTTLWLGLGLAALLGIAGATAYGVTRKR